MPYFGDSMDDVKDMPDGEKDKDSDRERDRDRERDAAVKQNRAVVRAKVYCDFVVHIYL